MRERHLGTGTPSGCATGAPGRAKKGAGSVPGKKATTRLDAGADKNAPGTIKFSGRWETIDRVQTTAGLGAEMKIFVSPYLLEPDRRFGGLKPRRTYSGPRYLGGVSDHLPVLVSF